MQIWLTILVSWPAPLSPMRVNAREKAMAEVKKLRTMSPMSAEATVVRNYLDWILSLPWKKQTRVSKDIRLAQSILDTFYSDAQQQANKEVQDASGFLGTLGAMARNPSTTVQTGVESLPLMLGGAGVARGLLAAGGKTLAAGVAGPALPGFLARTFGQAAPLVAGAAGEGVIAAGSAAENYREAGGVLTVGQVAAAIASGGGLSDPPHPLGQQPNDGVAVFQQFGNTPRNQCLPLGPGLVRVFGNRALHGLVLTGGF